MVTVENLLEEGRLLLEQEQYETALVTFQEADRLFPDNERVQSALGVTYYLLQQYRQSVEYLEKSLQINRDDFLTWYCYGNTLIALEQYQAALSAYAQALDLNPDFQPAREQIEQYLSQAQQERNRSYLQLIQALLDCAEGEEGQILTDNQHLLDDGLIATMQEVADDFDNQAENGGAWLRNVANNLATYLSNAQPSQEHFDFLLEILRSIADGATQEQVYDLFRQNLDKIDLKLAQALQIWANDRLANLESEQQTEIANVIWYFCNFIKDFPLGNKLSNIEIAITGYQINLTVFSEQESPQAWAATQNNLGNAYSDRIEGDRRENLEHAISSYLAALRIRTEAAFPIDWAMTQNNLGTAYGDRIAGDRRENLEMAIVCYCKALTIRTPESDPIGCLQTARNLGNLAFSEDNWQLAIDAYSQAITAVEQSREWASNRDSKQEIIENAIDVYQNIVQVYINLGQLDRAIEFVERGKTRNLVELLANRDLYPKGDIPPAIITRLDSLRQQIIAEENLLRQQQRMAGGNANNPEAGESRGLTINSPTTQTLDRTRLHNLRQELEHLILRDIQPIDPAFLLTQQVKPISFQQIKETLSNPHTAAIEWYVREDSLSAFLVATNQDQPLHIAYTSEQFQALITTASEYLDTYQQRYEEWQNNLPNLCNELAKNLQLETIVAQIKQIIPDCNQLILVPHRWLHLLPLHALPLCDNNCLIDRFPNGVSYAPSIQLLQLTQQQTQLKLRNFFAIQNPTEDLDFTNLEVEVIRTWFQPQDDVLARTQAAKAVLAQERDNKANYTHFSCHGYFNFANPELSALLLAGSMTDFQPVTAAEKSRYLPARNGGSIDLEKCLTLGEIFGLDLRQCRLVVLSACETGLTDFRSLSDEYIGLPSGFIYAGSPSVVSSLWAVNDLSTAFLTIKLYQNLQGTDSVAVALNQAQSWLRDATKEALEAWIYPLLVGNNRGLKFDVEVVLSSFPPQSHPFASPYHWGAFCAVGS